MSETCATCRFWGRDGFDPAGIEFGQCRRHAPRGLADAAADEESYYSWPDTIAQCWCGEHQPREPEQPKAREPLLDGPYWIELREPGEIVGPWIGYLKGQYWHAPFSGLAWRQDAVTVLSARLERPV